MTNKRFDLKLGYSKISNLDGIESDLDNSEIIVDLTKKLGNNVLSIIELDEKIKKFLNSLESPNDIESFSKFSRKLGDELLNYFKDDLSIEDENFKICFSYGITNILSTLEDEKEDKIRKEKLNNMIIEKNSLKSYFLLVALDEGKLDFLSLDDKNTISNLIKTRVFDYMNIILHRFNKELDKPINKEIDLKFDDIKKFKVGALFDGHISSYESFVSVKEFIKGDFFKDISDDNFRKYFEGFYQNLESGSVDFKDYLKLQDYSLNTWGNSESQLGLTVPEESYLKENLLIDPELELFLKKEDDYYKPKNIETSEKFFGTDFDMGKVQFFISEPILSGGFVSFVNILGKSFPCDKDLSKERGIHIYSNESRFADIVVKIKKYLDIMGLEKIDEEYIGKIVSEHVAFHEYGHSLFIHGNEKSSLEEAKASLFHYLYLKDQFDEVVKDDEYIKNFLDFSVIELTKKTLGKGQSFNRKYLIREKINLRNLLKSGLISIDSESNIKYNISKEKFKKFLELSMDVLFTIRDFYNEEADDMGEKFYLNTLNNDTDEYIEKLFIKLTKKED